MQNDSKLLSVKWENGMINQPASFLAKVLFFSHQRLRGGLDGRSHGAQVQPEMQSGVHDQILRHHCVVIHMAIRQLHGTLIYSYLTCCSYVIIINCTFEFLLDLHLCLTPDSTLNLFVYFHLV